jgi:hypothetical protein
MSWDKTTISKMGPTIAIGSTKAQCSKAKHINRVRAAQSNQTEGRSDTWEGQYFGAPGAPSRGPSLLKLRV